MPQAVTASSIMQTGKNHGKRVIIAICLHATPVALNIDQSLK
jgi:hypothetical protein